MSRWFRMYADQIRNPKVMRLSDSDFRMWVDFLSLASENDGRLPPVSDLAHMCHKRVSHINRVCATFTSGGLLDLDGDGFVPHNWKKRQYKSDTSTERVQKFRRFRNVSETVNETPPESETESEIPLPNGKGRNGAHSEPVGSGAVAPLEVISVPKVDADTAAYFKRGREILGGSHDAGRVLAAILKNNRKNVGAARLAMEQAANAVSPVIYAHRLANGPPKRDDDEEARRRRGDCF